MQLIAKYQAKDGREFSDESSCAKHEQLLDKVEYILDRYLGRKQHPSVESNKGYFQHEASSVKAAWKETIELARPLFKSFNWANASSEEIHPMGVIGRIIDDSNSPIGKLHYRFMCIDDKYREWQQPYFAINPDKCPQVKIN